jgi:hypothetical protein
MLLPTPNGAGEFLWYTRTVLSLYVQLTTMIAKMLTMLLLQQSHCFVRAHVVVPHRPAVDWNPWILRQFGPIETQKPNGQGHASRLVHFRFRHSSAMEAASKRQIFVGR